MCHGLEQGSTSFSVLDDAGAVGVVNSPARRWRRHSHHGREEREGEYDRKRAVVARRPRRCRRARAVAVLGPREGEMPGKLGGSEVAIELRAVEGGDTVARCGALEAGPRAAAGIVASVRLTTSEAGTPRRWSVGGCAAANPNLIWGDGLILLRSASKIQAPDLSPTTSPTTSAVTEAERALA